jgi:predicted RNA-binding protein with PUA-like domain
MTWWLMKTEPEEFSIDDLERVGTEPWTGIRNYQVRNWIRDRMTIGDGVLIYHSNCAEPGVVGIGEIASDVFPDETQFDAASDYHDPKSTRAAPRWLARDVRFVRGLKKPVTLARMRVTPALDGFQLLARGNRLSILDVSPAQLSTILDLEQS